MDFTEIFRGISAQMQTDFKSITSQIPHMGDRGSNREEVIKDFLKKHLPGKYDIGSGQAISVDKQISRQLDCVIYAKSSCPLWYNNHTQIFPSESVCAVTEIKSTIDKSVLEVCIENIRSVRKLPKMSGNRPLANGVIVGGENPSTFGCVFAFSSNTSLETLRDNLNVMNKVVPPSERISLLCVLDKGILLNMDVSTGTTSLLPDNNTTVVSIESKDDSLLLFFLLLSSYLNAIEVMPPDLIKYAAQFLNTFSWQTKKV